MPGFYSAYVNGNYLDANDAYLYYLSILKIPNNSFVNTVLSSTAFGSLLWSVCHPRIKDSLTPSASNEDRISITKNYMDTIESFCQANDLPVIFSVIPDSRSKANRNRKRMRYDALVKEIFEGKNVYYMPNFGSSDFNEPKDWHFSNEGSLRYAEFLDELISNNIKNVP